MTVCLAIAIASWLPAADPVIELNPFPQELESRRGRGFELSSAVPLVIRSDADAFEVQAANLFNDLSGLSLPVRRIDDEQISGGAVRVGVDAERFLASGKRRAEAYRLTIDRSGVRLEASDRSGLLYGYFLLLKLAQVSRTLPFVSISDYPDVPVRGAITDVALAPEELADLAREGGNVVVFMASADFDADVHLKSLFDEARNWNLEPVAGHRLDAHHAQEWPAAVERFRRLAAELDLQHLYVRAMPRFVWHGTHREAEARRRLNERLGGLLAALPSSTYLLVEFPDSLRIDNNTLPPGAIPVAPERAPLRGLPGRPYIIRAKSASAAYAAAETIEAEVSGAGSLALGVWVDHKPGKSRRWAFDKLWNTGASVDPWPHGLNAYFGSELFDPYPDEVLGAMVNRFNRQILANVEPADELQSLRSYLKAFRKAHPDDLDELDRWEDIYRALADYAELETRFRSDPHWTVLRDIVEVVQFMAGEYWEWDADRTQYIVDVIQKQRIFVPPSILFGHYVVPAGGRRVPEGARLLEIPVEPEYAVEKHRVDVAFSAPLPFAPVARLDFEAVNAATLLLEQSSDGHVWRTIDHLSSAEPVGLQAPIELATPILASRIRAEAIAPLKTIQFRNARLFGLKPVAEISVPEVPGRPTLSGSVHDSDWGRKPGIFAFVTPEGELHGAPLVVSVARNETGLWLAGRVARWGRHERIEIWVEPAGGDRFRTALRPNLAAEVSAFGIAQVTTDDAFEIHIPWSVLGGRPSAGTSWRADVRRIDADGNTMSRWAEGRITDLPGRLVLE